MIKIIVTGSSGQLGKACVELLSFYEGYSVFGFDRRQLDISDPEIIERVLTSLKGIQYWINCAAYTKVDEAETNPEMASLYNAVAPGLIAHACRKHNVHLFHFSSDYVYHNEKHTPLQETDPVTPQGVYAKSKLAGEQAIIATGVKHTILRTSWVYGPGGRNFVNTMIKLGRSKPIVQVVEDQVGAPTFTYDIVQTLKYLMDHDVNGRGNLIQGVFNFANQGETNWADFAKTIFHMANISCQVIPTTSIVYGAPAPRPEYSVLNCQKISALLPMPIPHWENALQRFLDMSEEEREPSAFE